MVFVHRLAYGFRRNAGCPLLMVDIIALRASAVLRIWEKGGSAAQCSLSPGKLVAEFNFDCSIYAHRLGCVIWNHAT